MAVITKPTSINKFWAAGGDKATPLDNKIAIGWQVEIPPRQWFNWWMNRTDQAIGHINQFGIPVWDSATEYREDRSYVQGPTNGVVYRATQTHTNQNPETTTGYWEVAFDSFGSGFSEAAADAKYLAKDQNGADIPSKTTFRNQLSVYSKAEVDGIVPRGFISFNGATGAVLASRNLSLTKLGAGSYRITIDPAARRGNSNYCVIVGAIDTGVTSQARTLNAGALNTTTASVGTRSTDNFEINCVLRDSLLQYAGGNDANNAQAIAINLADNSYINAALYW